MIKKDSLLRECDLSIRAINCLNAAEIYTVGELLDFGVDNLLKFRHIGKKTITELKEFLSENGCLVNDDTLVNLKRKIYEIEGTVFAAYAMFCIHDIGKAEELSQESKTLFHELICCVDNITKTIQK